MTLDLTKPDHKHKEAASGKELRRNFKAKWLNANLETTSSQKRKLSDATGTLAAEGRTTRPEIDGVSRRPEGTGSDGENGRSSKVQILGLHSRNPIVAYRGTIYSCKWASNIGTELLFIEHDPNSVLPVLRNLPGQVDLLAASSTRIMSSIIDVESKAQSAAPPQPKRRKVAKGKDPTLVIPVGMHASDKRKSQARFLQRLMEIKEERGEKDEVTVYTQKKLSRAEWREHLAQKRDEERVKLQKIVRKSKRSDSVQQAKERLAELDEENEKAKEVQARWLAESRVQGTTRTRIKGRSHDAQGNQGGLDKNATSGSLDGSPYRESPSLPTPQRWEIEDNGDDDMQEDYSAEYDEGMDGKDSYEDDKYGDEDEDPDEEDEDTQAEYG